MIDYYELDIDLTLLGCGFLGEFARWLIINNYRARDNARDTNTSSLQRHLPSGRSLFAGPNLASKTVQQDLRLVVWRVGKQQIITSLWDLTH